MTLAVLAVVALGCSHEEHRARHAPSHATTGGGERRATARHEADMVAREAMRNDPPTAAEQSESGDDVEITR